MLYLAAPTCSGELASSMGLGFYALGPSDLSLFKQFFGIYITLLRGFLHYCTISVFLLLGRSVSMLLIILVRHFYNFLRVFRIRLIVYS